MPDAVPPADVRVRRVLPSSDVALLRANTHESIERLTDHYWARALRIARSILDDGETAARVVAEAAEALAPTRVQGRRPSGPVGPRLMAAAARHAVRARAAGSDAGVTSALSDGQCTAVGMVFYGRMSVRSVARELELAERTVAADIEAGLRRLRDTCAVPGPGRT